MLKFRTMKGSPEASGHNHGHWVFETLDAGNYADRRAQRNGTATGNGNGQLCTRNGNGNGNGHHEAELVAAADGPEAAVSTAIARGRPPRRRSRPPRRTAARRSAASCAGTRWTSFRSC